MRQINFLIIFALCLALVLFSIENTDPVVIHIVKGVDLQAPLSIELLLAMGVGAILAWFFSVWSRLQSYLDSRQVARQRDRRIQELEDNLDKYKVELEEQQRFLPASQQDDARESGAMPTSETIAEPAS